MNLQSHFQSVRQAARTAVQLDTDTINSVLRSVADEAERRAKIILAENQKDLDRMDPNDPKYDRLQLNEARIQAIASDLRKVSELPSPLNKALEERQLENGLTLRKVTVPMGVIGIIYEARPNVTFDVFSLCLKSGNACILKGGRDADDSNRAIVSIIHQVLQQHNLDRNLLYLMPPSREATQALLEAVGYVDMLIPRGSQGLINYRAREC